MAEIGEGGRRNSLNSVPEILERKLLKVLREAGEEGILQRELWEKLDIDSRKGVRLVRRLERRGLLTRISTTYKGRRAYIVKISERALEKTVLPRSLEDIPCFSCTLLKECGEKISTNPINCPKLNKWLLEGSISGEN